MKSNLKRLTRVSCRKLKRQEECRVHGLAVVGACMITAMILAVSSKAVLPSDKNEVYAASEEMKMQSESKYTADVSFPTGIAGVIYGVRETEVPDQPIKRIGTSFENVMVGQRVQKVENTVSRIDASSSMANTLDEMEQQSIENAQTPLMMSDEDYGTLLAIVEAEAGGEDLKGKVLVANVIMNRVNSEQFPDTVTEVVWDTSGGAAQFSPTIDGRISTVEISEETEEAVRMAMEGVDYSDGALFFVAREQADQENVKWFDKDLHKLFRHGVHDFYTYPELADS